MTAGRRVALSLLEQADRGRRLDLAWAAAAGSLGARERPWVHELAFGTARLRGRLDHLLDRHLSRGLDSVPDRLLTLLRLGAYQLLYMGSVPDYAAVSQTASQASGLAGAKGAGLVNAVLRALAAAGDDPAQFPDFRADPAGHLSSWGSHPRWLVERWIRRFGADEARRIVEAGNRIPRLFLRPVGTTREEAAERLRAAGLDVSVDPDEPRTVPLPPNSDPSRILALVPGIIQDPAAARAADFLPVAAGERVADLCAAPGGKAVALLDAGAWVVGLDPSQGRLDRMRASLRRLGLPCRLVVARGEDPPLTRVDAALVDVPCTGTATLARHPDARWRLRPEDPDRMSRVQARILEGASAIVRPGGRLAYSTCTLEVEENEEMVEAFLQLHGDFDLEDVLRIRPGGRGTDGAFVARLRRRP